MVPILLAAAVLAASPAARACPVERLVPPASPPGPGSPGGEAESRLGVVFAGGGAKAAYEAGVALALHERGLAPAVVAGTSSGAINAAFLAAGEAERLAGLWRGLRRSDVYGIRGPAVLGGLLPGFLALPTWGGSSGLLDPAPLRHTLSRQVDLDRIRASPVRLLVVATDLRTGTARRFDNATLSVDALVASASVPGLFPAVSLNGDLLVDGGVVQRAPVLELLGAHRVDRLLVVSAYESDPPRALTARAGLERAFELALTREAMNVG